jgi:two-component system, NarL family, response regulator YdfI
VIRLLIAADALLVRAGLESLLKESAGVEVVGSIPPAQLARQVVDLHPDVVVMEWERHDEEHSFSSIAFGAFGDEPRGPEFVLLTDETHAAWVFEALRAGARAVLPRDATAEELEAAVTAAAAGLVAIHPEIANSLLNNAPAPATASAGRTPQSLTPREVEVLRMLAEGLGNKEIAWQLGISEHTVKFHVASIFTKLDAASRTEAVMIGVRLGLIIL